MVKFGDLMKCGSKDYSKMHPVPFTFIHHDVIDLVNQEMDKNIKI